MVRSLVESLRKSVARLRGHALNTKVSLFARLLHTSSICILLHLFTTRVSSLL